MTFSLMQTQAHAGFLTRAERAMVEYLTIVVGSSPISSTTHVNPWIICKDGNSSYDNPKIFMSSPVAYSADSSKQHALIMGWLEELLELGTQFSIHRGYCTYRFEYFGRCLSTGTFSILFDLEKVTFFEIIRKQGPCESRR